MYNYFCQKFLNICIYIANILGYNIIHKKNIDSFIIDNNDIEILHLSHDIDKENVFYYIRHHIMYTDDTFIPIHSLDEPLAVKFKYLNETYTIYLNKLISKNNEHSVIYKEPKILYAVMNSHTDNNEIHITDEIVELHGPTRNFYNHIPDIVPFSKVLHSKYGNGKIITLDMIGNQKEEYIIH